MNKLFPFVFFLSMAIQVFASIDTIAVDVGISVFKTMPIGVVPFTEPSGTSLDWPDEKPHEVAERDLNLSGRFEIISVPKFDLVKLSRARAKFYVTGKIEKALNNKIKIDCFLYATQSKDLILGESYTVSLMDSRKAVHEFIDKVIYQLWGVHGVASTKLAWVSKIDGVKQIVVADYDGFHRRQLTFDSTISMMPVWSHDNERIIFVSFRNNKPQLYIKDVATGTQKRLFKKFEQTFSPAVNPKTGEILFSAISGGKTDLYIGDPETQQSRRLSFLKSSQTSPSWSPNSSEIIFTSDRGGSPQIYVMNSDGTDMRRMTFMGRYNERASWAPTGDRIVYTSMDDGKMNIYTCAIDGSDIVQLTSNSGNNERPSWSPDGMLIAFSSNRSGSNQIYIMRRDGSNVTRITQGGDNTAPTWSWYPIENQTKQKEGKE